jgi:hypothetical protein
LLKETDKFECKPAKTSIEINIKVDTKNVEPLKDINFFQRLVEKLIYLTVIRSDLSFSVNQIGQFMHAQKTPHLDVINRILRYLKDSPGKEIWMRKNYIYVICGYSDANFVKSFDRKSTTGLYTFVGGNLVI